MNTMDHKGISWVGNIYLKFESTCLELEETMYQETAKYVENQVQTVGASVKKFYSDVMQDLLPPSSTDPMKVAAADLSLNPYADVGKKPKAKLKEDIIKVDKLLTKDSKVGVEAEHTSSFNGRQNLNLVPPSYSGGSIKGSELSSGKTKDGHVYERSNVCIKGISIKDNDPPPSKKSSSNNPLSKDQSRESPVSSVISENNEAARDWMAMILPQASFEVIGCDSTEGKIPNDLLDATVSRDDDSVKPPPSDSILSINPRGKKGRKLRCISSSGGISSEFMETCTNSGLVSQIGSCISDDSQYSQSDGEEASMSHKGDCNTDVVDNNDTTEPKVETIEQDGELKLEDTCVLVDRNELRFVSHGEGKHKSYKKIREAFSLKIGSARKHEYEQLAAQYGHTNTGSNLKCAETVMPAHSADSNTKKLLTHGFPESEWELL